MMFQCEQGVSTVYIEAHSKKEAEEILRCMYGGEWSLFEVNNDDLPGREDGYI